MTHPTRPQPPIGWYQTGRPTLCCALTERDRYRPDCRKQLPAGARVLVTGPIRERPRGLVLCEPCGQAFLDDYVEQPSMEFALALAERCLTANKAWEQDIALVLGTGPLILEEAP